MSRKIRVGVIFGGRSAEHEVSLQSARNVISALNPERFEVALIGIDKAGKWQQFLNVTDQVAEVLKESGVQSGVCTLFVPHTTAAITINENADPDVVSDMLEGLRCIVPHHQDFYRHAEGNSDAHIKTSLLGTSAQVLIENGKLTAPIRGATLVGNGPDILTKITMVGSDRALDPGIGDCGKAGQAVPTTVGMPTVKVSEMTVGGTATE